MGSNGATQEQSSVSEKNFLEKRLQKNVTAVFLHRILIQSPVQMYPHPLILSQLSCLYLKLSGAVDSSVPEHLAES